MVRYQAATGAEARRGAWALCLMLSVVVAACADKYELEPYAMAPGDRINSDRRARPGTFHFLADGGRSTAADAGRGFGLADGGGGDTGLGPYGQPKGDGDSTGASGADDATDDTTDDTTDDSDGGSGSLPDLKLCGHGSCATAADCGVDLAGVGSCNLALCVEGCCELAVAPPGSDCDDGDPCTVADQCQIGGCVGAPTVCDDGLACTSDQCDAVFGGCVHSIDAGQCNIDNVCVVAGESPAGVVCLWCDPKIAATDWSKKPDCCTSDAVCPHGGVCEEAKCDLSTGNCSLQKKIGCCTDNNQCDDSNACTIDTCDLASGKCAIVAKTCPDLSACQAGLCDGNTG